MSWARPCERDPTLPAQAGEPELCPPDADLALALCTAHLAIPGIPPPSSARLDYARWKPRVSITAGYTLAFPDGEERILALKRYVAGKARALARDYLPDERARRAEDRLSSFAVVEDSGTCLYVFPTDRVLPGAARIVNLRRTARLLNALPLDPRRKVRARRSSSKLLRYKPERRAVLRLDLVLTGADGRESGSTIAARALPPTEARRVSQARSASVEKYRGLRDMPDMPNMIGPRLLQVEERTGIVLEEWVEGVGHGSTSFDHAHETGVILARLHAIPPPTGSATASAALTDFQSLLGIDERLWSRARALATPPVQRAIAWTHGDIHPDQLVRERGSGRMRLLDLDALGIGDPARDLATWIADHLAADPAIAFAEAARPLLDGYRQASGLVPAEQDLAERVAFELVSLSASSLRRLERGAVARAELLLERAGDVFPSRRVRA